MKGKKLEVRVGRNSLYLDEDSIIRITTVGEINEETQIGINEAGYKLMNTVEGKVHALVDLNKTGKISPGARKRQIEISEYEKIAKIALFGLHPVARVIASFFMGISRNEDMRFFQTEKEALVWLKE